MASSQQSHQKVSVNRQLFHLSIIIFERSGKYPPGVLLSSLLLSFTIKEKYFMYCGYKNVLLVFLSLSVREDEVLT